MLDFSTGAVCGAAEISPLTADEEMTANCSRSFLFFVKC